MDEKYHGFVSQITVIFDTCLKSPNSIYREISISFSQIQLFQLNYAYEKTL